MPAQDLAEMGVTEENPASGIQALKATLDTLAIDLPQMVIHIKALQVVLSQETDCIEWIESLFSVSQQLLTTLGNTLALICHQGGMSLWLQNVEENRYNNQMTAQLSNLNLHVHQLKQICPDLFLGNQVMSLSLKALAQGLHALTAALATTVSTLTTRDSESDALEVCAAPIVYALNQIQTATDTATPEYSILAPNSDTKRCTG